MSSDGDGVLPSEFVKGFVEFLSSQCGDRLEEIIQASDNQKHYGVDIDVDELLRVGGRITSSLLTSPAVVIPYLDEAIQLAQQNICNELEEVSALTGYLEGKLGKNNGATRILKSALARSVLRNRLTDITAIFGGFGVGWVQDGSDSSVKRRVHARLYNLPPDSKYVKQNISMLRSMDVDLLICINVTVIRLGAVMLREVERQYECTRCQHRFTLQGDVTARGSFILPASCPSEGSKKCMGTNFRQLETEIGECHDYQEVKVQEKVGSLVIGSIPRSILVVLSDDLVDSCKPGDDAIITGILQQRWNRNPVVGSRCDLELLLEASSVRLCNEQKAQMLVPLEDKQEINNFWNAYAKNPLAGRNHIIQSICPEVYGMYLVKLIMAMSLIGGVTRNDPCGTKVRGESHLLIVGDPGTGKSQMLKYAVQLSPRAVITTGIGTTSAGLTVTAARDAVTGEWTLDAGALVLADGGLCCIDEFDSIRENDRIAIHEAMEQQTLSVAKAGLVCTLDTRATVFGATNPSAGRMSTNIASRPDESRDADQVFLNIASPLLSRFDVVLTLKDPKDNHDWDRQLSEFILNGRCSGDGDEAASGDSQPLWSTLKLQTYFSHVKKTLTPDLSEGARTLLSRYYAAERAAERRNAARTTVRLLESLIRLTQAHARLMFRPTAVVQDSVFAIAAVEASAVHPSVLGGSRGALHASVPEDPEADYNNFADYILVKLGLEGKLDVREGYDRGEFNEVSPSPTNESDAQNSVQEGPTEAGTENDSHATDGEKREQSTSRCKGGSSGDDERGTLRDILDGDTRENTSDASSTPPTVATRAGNEITEEVVSSSSGDQVTDTTPNERQEVKKPLIEPHSRNRPSHQPSTPRKRPNGMDVLGQFARPKRKTGGNPTIHLPEPESVQQPSAPEGTKASPHREAHREETPYLPTHSCSPPPQSKDLPEATSHAVETDPWQVLTAAGADIDDDLWDD